MKITKVVNFNTSTIADRNAPQFNLRQPIVNGESYSVTQFTGVNNFYTIDSRNNQLQFIEQDSLETIRTVVLPMGNYTITTMLSTLSTLMSAQSLQVYTVTNSTLKNRLSITASVTPFILKSCINHCYAEIGYENFSSTFALVQVALNSFDLSGVKCLNVCSFSFGYNNNIVVNKSLNVISSIPVTVPYTGIITYTPNLLYISAQLSEIQSVEFQLYDERFRPLFVDKDYQISIAFQI